MYPEFASKFWANLKLAYNLCDENQNIRVHDMRNYMKEKSQLGCPFLNIVHSWVQITDLPSCHVNSELFTENPVEIRFINWIQNYTP